ncbi:MAG TPA: ice-binding family protein [Polyangia bacterium]|jgi:Protein of unknown function (DUF3494).|nr:ice-binding family protein [Polyangia bacterium]
MKTFKTSALYLLLFLLPACGQRLVEFAKSGDAGTDAKANDARIVDARSADAVSPDVRNSDLGNIDVAKADVPNTDMGNIDAPNTDTTNADVARTDAPSTDARGTDVAGSDTPGTDARSTDARSTDAARLDATNADIAIIDAPKTDTSSIDVSRIDAPDADAGSIDGETRDAGGFDVENGDAVAAIVVNLGLAAPFAIAATAGVTNTITAPITHINGDVVLDPNHTCNAVTVDNAGGFGLCGGMAPTISGTVITDSYPDTTTAIAVRAALNAAFLSITPLAGPPAVGTRGGGTPIAAPTTLGDVAGSPLVLGDNWFTPGVYTSITSLLITGDVTLDGQGDPDATFIFQSASSLTTADGAPSPGARTRILLTQGTKASNVWWQVASSATIGLYSEFRGNILAAFDITMKTGATACGRSMAGAWVGGAGAFVFDSNVVSVPGNGCAL